ncbi:MAG: helix-turn-helix transcriptional regulator [Pseudonocardiales bacterium]|nr:helix-turn-helix transcriptional regulator [Pseudonocardiales bacterium]MBV9030255.1 helix-turn-helix transcriptional regulator [Pseudonocardiales bacterium]
MTATTVGEALRAARDAAGISLSMMAARTHYSKPYLSMVETGKRTATTGVVTAYERVLGIGQLGDDVDRFKVASLVAENTALATELAAGIAGNDPGPLATVQTTHGTDLVIATLVDRGAVARLRRWLDDGDDPVLRVNAAGILAKVPGQFEASHVTAVLGRDPDVRSRYMTAVVARVCGLDWPVAAHFAENPVGFPQPVLVAQRFAREAVSDRDVGARWCAAAMLKALSSVIGR